MDVDDMSITSDDGSVQGEFRALGNGRYEALVGSGSWLLTIDDGDDPLVRQVEVRDDPVVVGFDDFTTANTLAEIPNGYRGLDWSNWVATHRILYGGPGYVNVNTSGEYVAYNSSGNPATVSSEQPFDFVGASMGSTSGSLACTSSSDAGTRRDALGGRWVLRPGTVVARQR